MCEVMNVDVPFCVSLFFRSVMGSNKEPDLVHLEARTVDGRKSINFSGKFIVIYSFISLS